MKLILALLLSGVAYATASPTCSESELMSKCYTFDPSKEKDSFRDAEDYMNSLCKAADCTVDYLDRCGTSHIAPEMRGIFEQSRKIHNTICKKGSPLRQKYLDNKKCMNRAMGVAKEYCHVRPHLETTDPDYCPTIEKFLDCTEEVTLRECGKDARDVHTAISVDLEYYGCSE